MTDRLSHLYYHTYLIHEMKEQNYKDSITYLQSIRLKIDALNNSPASAPAVLKELAERVKKDHLGIIIALHNGKYLQNLLKAVQTQYQAKRNDEIEKNAAILHLYAFDCFFKLIPTYLPFFQFFNPKIQKNIKNKTYAVHGGENPRYQVMRRLLDRFNKTLDKDKEEFEQGKKLNQFILQHLNTDEPTTCFEESIYTFVRIRIEEIQSTILKNLKQQMSLCCKLHFEESEIRKNVETKNQNFSRELPKLKKEESETKQVKEIREIIRKQVVSYLNSTSGIYYLGIEHNPQKDAKFVGLEIGEQIKREFLCWTLNEIVMSIYPSDEDNDEETEAEEEKRMTLFREQKRQELSKCKNGFYQQHDINRYISVDFISLYNPANWFYARANNGCLKFIARIKAKLGDQYEVYHFINEKDVPQAYLRQDKKERKLTMIQYYQEVYRRLKSKANLKSEEPPKTHALCRVFFKDGKK